MACMDSKKTHKESIRLMYMSCIKHVHLFLLGTRLYSELPRSGKNIWKMNFFQVREKSGNFVDFVQGNLERSWKVREKVREFGNKWLWQADRHQKIYLVFLRGEKMYLIMR